MIVLDVDGDQIVDEIVNDTDNSPQAPKKRKAFITVVTDDKEDKHPLRSHTKQNAAAGASKERSKPVSCLHDLLSYQLDNANCKHRLQKRNESLLT